MSSLMPDTISALMSTIKPTIIPAMLHIHFYLSTRYSVVKYVSNSKINLRLVGKKKRVVIAPKHTLSSNK